MTLLLLRREDDDLTTISNIDLEKVNSVLRGRYNEDVVYTYSGSILISVNPYKELPFAYDESVMGEYSGGDRRSLGPHIYAIAESAYVSLKRTGLESQSFANQSIVISGESGAGKTETTKFVLNYLCHITSNVSTWVEHQILEANTILEAFGNAKTVRNDNSSRFGKFMQVCLDSRWMIRGCVIQDYLLEQSRITFQTKHERNYHVFYQITQAAKANEDVSKAYGVDGPESYAYLRGGSGMSLEGVDDRKQFDALRLAFNVLQIPAGIADGIFRTVSAVLHLGNLQFETLECSSDEGCCLSGGSSEIVEMRLGDLLGMSGVDLRHILLTRQINVRGNITEIPLKLSEANENRHAMAKALYSRTFQWLVSHINTCTNPGQDSQSRKFIGLLDIFGFENFEENSFEQFCINYTNEKLQKFFNNYVFAIEQEIYKSEGIKYRHIEFTDNSSCLELIEKPPRCLLKLLTEQCHLPKGSDVAYLTNISGEFYGVSSSFSRPDDRRLWSSEFTILHYAGPVTYRVSGFVDKNRDVQQDLFFHYLSDSKNEFVKEMVSSMMDPHVAAALTAASSSSDTVGRTQTNKCKPTVSEAFRVQLSNLVEVLQSTTPWYVRCIKPNMLKGAGLYDDELVKDQLKYLGMLEIIRIRREGYPIHFPFSEFVKRFKVIGKFRTYPPPKDIARDILSPYPSSEWQLGISKVFLKQSVYEPLELSRLSVLNSRALVIQSFFRACHVRKSYVRKRGAIIVVQRYYRTYKLRLHFLRVRRAAVTIQTYLRGMFAREVAAALREMRRVEEQMVVEKMEETKSKEFINLIQMLQESSCSGGGGDNHLMSPASSVAVSGIFDGATTTSEEEDTTRGGATTSTDGVEEEEEEDDDLTSAAGMAAAANRINNCCSSSVSPPPLPPPMVPQVEVVLKKPMQMQQVTTLPEPTVPPPPPPQQQQQMVQKPTQAEPKKKVPVVPTVPQVVPQIPPAAAQKKKKNKCSSNVDEPIYESIQPKIDPKLFQKPTPPPPAVPATSPPPAQTVDPRSNFIKNRLEALQQNQPATATLQEEEEDPLDLVTFACDYFNDWEKPSEFLSKGKQYYSKEEMTVKWSSKSSSASIPSSHIHLYDPSNVKIAVQLFHDLQKFARGELKPETVFLQTTIKNGLEREELRDEIYVQVVRQINGNENGGEVKRLYFFLCLIVACFPPSKIFSRFFLHFLNKNYEDCNVSDQVNYIKTSLKRAAVGVVRTFPPSSVEIQATQRLGTLVCRVFFADGRSKAVDVHPNDTAWDVILKLAQEINLSSVDNTFALYESNRDVDIHVNMHTLVYDVIAKWEVSPSKLETRFLFKKRLFRSREIPQDPVEVDLLFAQATHSVVKVDAYPISEKVSLQLAGLHMQTVTTDEQQQTTTTIFPPENFIPQRILRTRPHSQWVQVLAQAHKQYGQGKSGLVSKVWYLSCVMQYPLYGTSLFHVLYRGYWLYGNTLLLGVSPEGVSMIKPDDKFIMYEYSYDQIERVEQEEDNLLTINLTKSLPPDTIKCFVFETAAAREISSLIGSYHPSLATTGQQTQSSSSRRLHKITNSDRLRLHENVVNARRMLVQNGVLKKAKESGANILNLKNTLRRLKQRDGSRKNSLSSSISSVMKVESSGGGFFADFPLEYFSFSKYPISSSISYIDEEDVAVAVFNMLLNFAGVSGPPLSTSEEEASLLQSILERCWKKDHVMDELYLQLVKQTTDFADPNGKVNSRNWAALSLICSLVPPTNPLVRKYLFAHLNKCGADSVTIEGRFARFAEKCLASSVAGESRRQWSPSRQEILCTISMRPITARFYLMDGKYHTLNFTPNDTAGNLLHALMTKVGLSEAVTGYSLYELGSVNQWERSLLSSERPVEVMARWEKQRATNGSLQFKFVMKKHLFIDIDLGDPVEKELVYHQLLHQARNDRFPVSETEAAMLVALQAQVELGDYATSSVGEFPDYCHVSSHCLPTRIAASVSHEAVARHHQSLTSTHPTQAKQAVLNLLRSWPLHKAAIFDVTQSFTSNWPRGLWLAVDEGGVHLLQQRTRHTLCSFEYETIVSYSPSPTCFMLITSDGSGSAGGGAGSSSKPSKIVLNTQQGFQVSQLIKEYIHHIYNNRRNAIQQQQQMQMQR